MKSLTSFSFIFLLTGKLGFNSYMNYFVWNFLCKQDAIKKNKTPSTSKLKQKQKWYWRTKNVFLRRRNFSYMR